MAGNALETIEVEHELASRLREEAAIAGKSVPALVDDLLRLALDSHEPHAEPEPGYDEFLRRKVEKARESAAAGRITPNEEVEARFSERRAELRKVIAADRA